MTIMTKPDLPFYRPVADECDLFRTAHENGLPLLLKGPTGCGKTRFVEHMAAKLGLPLYTVACHDDLSAADLIGRYLLKGGETVWVDGPLTRAVREGGICYLDEVVEARKDVTVVLHPLTDDRRTLMMDRTGEELVAPKGFMLVASYNPGYQNVLKTAEALDAAAVPVDQLRFPATGCGNRRRGARKRAGRGARRRAGAAGGAYPQPVGHGPGGRCLDPAADLCGDDDRARHEGRSAPSKRRSSSP